MRLFILCLLVSCSSLSKERIAIVDTPLINGLFDARYLCPDGHYGNIRTNDIGNVHGTNIYNLVTKNIDRNRYCVVYIAPEMLNEGGYNFNDYLIGIKLIKNVKYVNMSLSGREPSNRERKILKNLLDKGINVFVAAGNSSLNLNVKKEYPASYEFTHNNFYVVGNRHESSNYGDVVDFITNGVSQGLYYKMTGTSQSTAIALNKFLRTENRINR